MILRSYCLKKSGFYFGAIISLLTLLVLVIKWVERALRGSERPLSLLVEILRDNVLQVGASLAAISLVLTLFFLLRELLARHELEAFLISGGSLQHFKKIWLWFVAIVATFIFCLQEVVGPLIFRAGGWQRDEQWLVADAWYILDGECLLHTLSKRNDGTIDSIVFLLRGSSVGADDVERVAVLAGEGEQTVCVVGKDGARTARAETISAPKSSAGQDVGLPSLILQYKQASQFKRNEFRKKIFAKCTFYLQLLLVGLGALLLFFLSFGRATLRWILLFVPYLGVTVFQGMEGFLLQFATLRLGVMLLYGAIWLFCLFLVLFSERTGVVKS